MSYREETRLLPTPDVAGHTEESRRALAATECPKFLIGGAISVKVDRVRNAAFDKQGQSTTYKFVVRYPLDAESRGGT